MSSKFTPFSTHYNRPPDFASPGEFNSGEVITNPTGYLPAERRIRDMFTAGHLLNAYRDFESRSYYDAEFETNPDDIPLDPTRSKSFDATDAQRYVEYLASKRDEHVERNRELRKKLEMESQQTSSTKDFSQTSPEPEAS